VSSEGGQNAGAIEVRGGQVTLSGQSTLSSTTSGGGAGGRIVVSAPTVHLMDEGRIEAGTNRGSRGDGGAIEVRAGTLTLTRGGRISASSESMGRGGDIQIAATHLQLSDGGTISTRSSGAGDAGTIRLQVGETFRSHNGAVTTAADQSGGGAIALRAGRLVQLHDSALTTSVRGGGGDAGNLTLDAPLVIAQDSQIVANAFGGRGGNIQITADAFLADPASLVSASSTLGLQGTVNIQAPVTSLSGTLAPLPQAFVSAAALLPARCAARFSGGKVSSLVLGGRGGLPLEPGGVLPSPLALEARLAADPALTGDPHRQASAAKFALLAGQEKALPRLGCPK
jgi:large exoprotein involved in heme utilization and adhesion